MQNLNAAAFSLHLTQASEMMNHSSLVNLKIKLIDDEIEAIEQKAKEKGIDIHNTAWVQEMRAVKARASQQMHLVMSFGNTAGGIDQAYEKALGELNQIHNRISAGLSRAADVHVEAGKAHHQFQSYLKDLEPELLLAPSHLSTPVSRVPKNEGFETLIQEAQIKNLSSELGKFGNGYSKSSDFLAELVFGSEIKESENPVRDKVIHASVHIGSAEVGPLIIGGPYALAASFGSRILEQFAKETAETVDPLMEKIREQIAPFEALDALMAAGEDRPSVIATTYIASGLLRAAQMPSEAVKFIESKLSSLAVQGCDKIGLTEANMLKALELTAKYDSENMAEAVAIADKVTPQATFEALKEVAFVVGEAMSKFEGYHELP